MKSLYLLDATSTPTNAVELKFLSSNGEIIRIIDDKYKSYFFSLHPLPMQDAEVVKYFGGEAEVAEKVDLFTDEKKTLTRIQWPNPSIAAKAAEKFSKCWEDEVEFPRSYVYDRGLAFGASHSIQDNKPILDAPKEVRERFDEIFGREQAGDPLKYAQIHHWFRLLNQPIPASDHSQLGIDEKAAPEKVYTAWMLARIANLPLDEAFISRRVSDWIKAMIHTHLRRNNVLIPNEEELRRGRPAEGVTGALTVAPKPGTYFNTVVCDFESLYPSCIDSFNLSYETIDCPHVECFSNRIPDIETHVCTKRRGFYAVLMGALKELRIRIYKPASRDTSLPEEERRKAEAAAKLLKLILVSSYGVTVRIHGVACPPLAEAITGYGRYVLRESWKMAEERGLEPLYGDTDSLFLDNASSDQVEWLIKAVKERFKLDLVVDKRYSLCVLPKAKKAYFGILMDGKPDIKGVTAIKSNAPSVISKVFMQCINELSTATDRQSYEEAKKRMKKIVAEAVAGLNSRQVKLEDMIYTVKLYFDPNEKIEGTKAAHQPYQCAVQLMNAGRKLTRGATISFIKVKPFKYKGRNFTVKPADFVTKLSETNTSDYVRNLLTALNQTFEPMGIKLESEKDARISEWLPR